MVLKLYGLSVSTCTRRVAHVLHEKNIPYELHTIDFHKGEQKAPEFTALQPFGQVPCIDDDGVIVYESRAIARYIDSKWPDNGPRLSVTLFDADPSAFALFEQACSIEHANFDIFASIAVGHLVFYPMFGKPSDKALAHSLLKTLEAKLDGYEVILSKHKYLAGDNFTLADLFHLPYGSLLPACGFTALEDGSRPNVARWWKDITSRPAWLAVKDGVPEELIKA